MRVTEERTFRVCVCSWVFLASWAVIYVMMSLNAVTGLEERVIEAEAKADQALTLVSSMDKAYSNKLEYANTLYKTIQAREWKVIKGY
jgi:uncharacterized protein (UPF0333 family)